MPVPKMRTKCALWNLDFVVCATYLCRCNEFKKAKRKNNVRAL